MLDDIPSRHGRGGRRKYMRHERPGASRNIAIVRVEEHRLDLPVSQRVRGFGGRKIRSSNYNRRGEYNRV